ncbi:hypothetical protein ACHAWC_004726 [Mediolabrus comicus]
MSNGGDNTANEGKHLMGKNDMNVLGQQFDGLNLRSNELIDVDPSLCAMPDTILLHIFGFILAIDEDFNRFSQCDRKFDRLMRIMSAHSWWKTQLALEKTCRRLKALLGKDSTMKLLYSPTDDPQGLQLEFNYQVRSLREKLFIVNGIWMTKTFQSGGTRGRGTDHLICHYIGGADGLRRTIDKILVQMEQPVTEEEYLLNGIWHNHGLVIPPEFPPNGFKLFLRGDSIAYLAEVVEQHMVQRLEGAMQLAIFRSKPADRHPYPTVCPDDIVFVDAMGTNFDLDCCVVGRHQKQGRHICQKLSLAFGDRYKKWVWPENDCMDDEIIGAMTMQRLVRAIASRAGIVKLSGPAFDCIAAEILHFLAVIVIDAFETSKSLWCHGTDVARLRTLSGLVNQVIADDIICDLSKCSLASSEDSIHSENSHDSDSSFEFNHLSNYPPLSWTVDEEGKLVCVIIPRQIKDAAVRLGMKPLLDDQRWEVSEGRTKKEEVKEALLMYGLSLDDESSMLDEDSESSMSGEESDESGEYEPSESGSEPGSESEFESEPESD